MGEAAEMLLDGTLCECCGVFLDGESNGYPGYCSKSCAEDRGAVYDDDDHFHEGFLEAENDLLIIKEALKEYKKIAYSFKCKKDSCKKTTNGIKHTENCHAKKHKILAKEAWELLHQFI